MLFCNRLGYFTFIFFPIVCIDYPVKIDTLEAQSTTDAVVQESSFVPRRSKPNEDPNKKKNKRKACKFILNLLLIL